MKCFCASLVLALTLVSQARGDFTFIHASDTHTTSPENVRMGTAIFKEIAELAPQPKFVIVTGDIVDSGTDAEYAQFAEVAKNLNGIPLYLAPGNHDVRSSPRGKDGYTRGTNGKLYRSWDYENIHFVTLDSTVLFQNLAHFSQEQVEWLKADLEKVGTDKPIIIGFHHFINRPQVLVDNEMQLLDVVAPYNVVLWLQGHGHNDLEWNVNGAPATMVKGVFQGGYDIIEVDRDELRITKRFIPPNAGRELLGGATQPEKQTQGQTRPLMTIPLKKQPRPKITLAPGDSARLAVQVDPAPDGTLVDWRPTGGTYKPMNKRAGGWEGQIDRPATGQHEVHVRVTLPDQRVYFVPWRFQESFPPAWQTNVGGAVQSRLLLDGETLFVTSMSGDLVAINRGDGKERFRVKTAGPVFSSPEVFAGTVYFGSSDHFVYAADSKSGAVKWRHETGGAVVAGPAVAKGIVCIGSIDTTIYGLGIADGAVRWKVQGESAFQSKAGTDGERFFIGGWDNHFRCIDAASGAVVWDLILGKPQKLPGFPSYTPAIAHPCVGGGKVFVSTNDGVLHAIRISDGKEVWKVDRKNTGSSSPCYRDGRIYFALGDKGDTFCADAENGEIVWQRNVGSVIYDSGFCLGGDNVFVGCVNGLFSAIDLKSGEIAWQCRLGNAILLATGVADEDRVYIGTMSGEVTALPTKIKRD